MKKSNNSNNKSTEAYGSGSNLIDQGKPNAMETTKQLETSLEMIKASHSDSLQECDLNAIYRFQNCLFYLSIKFVFKIKFHNLRRLKILYTSSTSLDLDYKYFKDVRLKIFF